MTSVVPDSVRRARERLANMQAETDRTEREQAEAEARQKTYEEQKHLQARQEAADADIRQARRVTDIQTREQLLEHIRQMREEKPPEVVHETHRTPRQMEEYNAEVEAGRAAVAKAEALMDYNRELQRKIEAEQAMTAVHRQNPSQDEQFPASGGTLGKRK
jgi:hypothetical protein